MKKLLTIISILICFKAMAQLPCPPICIDTTPDYKYMFYGDSVGFINNEYVCRTYMVEGLQGFAQWSFPFIDTTEHNIYLCETPPTNRLKKIPEITPIFDYLVQFKEGEITLLELKESVNASDVSQDIKDLIMTITYVNIKKYRLNDKFKNFKYD